MAIVRVTIGPAGPRDVLDGAQSRSETITSSATAASGTLIAARNEYAQVWCESAIYARSGGAAAAGNAVFVPPSTPTFIIMTEGQPVSVIDA